MSSSFAVDIERIAAGKLSANVPLLNGHGASYAVRFRDVAYPTPAWSGLTGYVNLSRTRVGNLIPAHPGHIGPGGSAGGVDGSG
jgi:hypothetical protein